MLVEDSTHITFVPGQTHGVGLHTAGSTHPLSKSEQGCHRGVGEHLHADDRISVSYLPATARMCRHRMPAWYIMLGYALGSKEEANSALHSANPAVAAVVLLQAQLAVVRIGCM